MIYTVRTSKCMRGICCFTHQSIVCISSSSTMIVDSQAVMAHQHHQHQQQYLPNAPPMLFPHTYPVQHEPRAMVYHHHQQQGFPGGTAGIGSGGQQNFPNFQRETNQQYQSQKGPGHLPITGSAFHPRGQHRQPGLPFRNVFRSTPLFLSCDQDSLSSYQCSARKQIELFEARQEDVESTVQGRTKPVVLGLVGIRCRHCAMVPVKLRARGAVCYPKKLMGLYQAAQSLAAKHLCEHCRHIPKSVREALIELRKHKSSAGGGRRYWADAVRALGVYESKDGLRWKKP